LVSKNNIRKRYIRSLYRVIHTIRVETKGCSFLSMDYIGIETFLKAFMAFLKDYAEV